MQLTIKQKAVVLSIIRQALRESWITQFNGEQALEKTRELVKSKLESDNIKEIDIITAVILQKLASMF